MPTAREKPAVAVYENKIYAISGCIAADTPGYFKPTYVNEVYDLTTGMWTTKAPIPIVTSSDSFSASVIENKIYFVNGALIQVYDPVSDLWVNKTTLPEFVTYFMSAVVDNKIFVISGSTQLYDPATDQWSSGASIPNAVINAAAGTLTNTANEAAIYVIGGQTSDDPLHGKNFTQIYFPKNNSWTTGASMPFLRASLGVAVVNNMLYAIGGGSTIFLPISSTTLQYNPTGSWTPDQTPTPATASPSLSPKTSTSQSLPPSLLP